MNRLLLLGLGVAAATLTGAALTVEPFRQGPDTLSASDQRGQVALGVVWIVAGLIAWQRRPRSRVGALMTAFGFADLARHVAWHEALPFTLTTFVAGIDIVIAAHLFLAYPSGRLSSRFERSLVTFGYAVWLVLSLATLSVWDPHSPGECPACPRNVFLLAPSPAAV